MCLAALETSSLPSFGEKPKAMSSPSQGWLLHRLHRIPTFFCLLKVKGTTNRVVRAKGHETNNPREKFPTLSHPWDDGYSTTSVLELRRDMLPISQEDYLVHEVTNYQLLRYSIFGWDKFPISKEEFLHPWGDKLSTTTVIDLWMGQVPYLPRGFLSSTKWQIIRLLRYLI